MSQRILSGTFGCAPHRARLWCWGILTLILLGMLSAQFLEGQRAEAQGGDPNIINAPQTYEEALIGTDKPMLPVAGGKLIDAGTANAIRGMDNLVGPFLDEAPDAGWAEYGLGVPWTGPRSFANLLAYGVPNGWQISSMSDLPGCAAVGLPTGGTANAFRVLLTRTNPDACILATFEEFSGEARWSRLDAIVAGQAGDTELVKRVSFRDGLDGRIVERGGNAHLLGGRIDDEGVLNVVAGVAAGNLAAPAAEPGLQIQDDLFTFFRSLTYAWYLQDVSNPISLNFVTPPAPGVVPVGAAAAPSTGNAVVPGTLHGDVTTNASIIWDVEGDVNEDATGTVQFRRQGTTQWRDALDLSRINYTDQAAAETRNRLTGSIFNLSPGTIYDVEIAMTDPDGGGETRTTTFTTRQVPKVPQGGRVIEVRDTDNLDAVTATAQPGDTFLFHAGVYTSQQNGSLWMIDKFGTRETPILFRSYGDGDANFTRIRVAGNHIWLDGLQVVTPVSTDPTNRGIAMFSPSGSPRLTGVSITRNTVKNGWFLIHAQKANDSFISDNFLIGAGQDPSNRSPIPRYNTLSTEGIEFEKATTRGHVVAFNEIMAVNDGVSYGGGNIDVHNNRVHDTYDDSFEPDYAWDNYRVRDNLGWASVETNFSFQPIKGGPWYIFRNQFTGTKYNPFKMEDGATQYIVNNTVVSTRKTKEATLLFRRGSAFANNYWKALSVQGGPSNSLGDNHLPVPDPSLVRLWGYNRYDAHPQNVWGWWGSLANAQALGAELHTCLVNSGTCPGSVPGANQAPSVSAGPDQTITLPSSANLDGTVTDDGLPNPPAAVTTLWSTVSGPGTVTFGNAAAEDTTASFSVEGTYVLQLTGDDSALSASDDLQVTVQPPPAPSLTITKPTAGGTYSLSSPLDLEFTGQAPDGACLRLSLDGSALLADSLTDLVLEGVSLCAVSGEGAGGGEGGGGAGEGEGVGEGEGGPPPPPPP